MKNISINLNINSDRNLNVEINQNHKNINNLYEVNLGILLFVIFL